MAATPALVNRQFNSPMKLYSPEVVADTLSKQTQVLANGALGIDFNQIKAPGNLANSAVLRMLEEEAKKGSKENNCIEYSKPKRRVQRFDWPPKPNGPDDPDPNNNDDNNNYNYNNVNTNVNQYGNNVYKMNNKRHHFNTTTISICTSPGLKRVAWPPLPDSQTNIIERELVYTQEPAYNDSPLSPDTYARQQKEWAPESAPQLNSHQSPPAQHFAQEPVFQRIVQAPAPAFEPPPTFVTLRSSAPVRQVNAPVYESQPAATQGGLGPRMRGDQKWPPEANKAQAVAENQARQALAKGPAVRPRAVKKDYSQFFAQNALTTTYPGYRAPPGTQHYVEEGTSNF